MFVITEFDCRSTTRFSQLIKYEKVSQLVMTHILENVQSLVRCKLSIIQLVMKVTLNALSKYPNAL